MENVIIESLIAQKRVVTTADLATPANDYMVVGVYQNGTSKSKGDGTSYKNYVISIAELLGGGSAYTASNGIVLIGNDFQLASGSASLAWAPDGNKFGAEKYIGTNDNFALPFRVFSKEVARFTTDAPGSTRMYINANTNLHGSNAGIQYSSDGSSPNRSQIRFNLYGANTGAPGVTGFKSRGAGIGSTASVLAGDNLFRITSIGVSGNNTSINLASLIDVRVASVLPGYLATDFVIALNSIAGVMTERLYVTSEGNVGIGTSTPGASLHVQGSDSTSANFGLKVQDIAGNLSLYIRNDGAFILGQNATAFDAYSVTVGAISTTIGTRAIAVGPQTTAASYSVVIGDTSYTIGGASTFNTLIGAGSLINGNTNLAIGGGNNVVGSRNVFLGSNMGALNVNDAIVIGNQMTTLGAGTLVIGQGNSFNTWMSITGNTLKRTLRMHATDASGGSVINNSELSLKSSYYNGAVPVDHDFKLSHIMDTVAPTSHVEFTIAGNTRMDIYSDGRIRMSNLPIVAGAPGELWNNAGVVNIA